MKKLIKKTAALCGSALIIIVCSLSCFSLSRHSSISDTDNHYCQETIAYNNEQKVNADNFNILTSKILTGVRATPMFNPYPSYSFDIVDSLLDSTVFGSWNDYFDNYNCYSYALGRTDDRFNIGVFSNHSLSTERHNGIVYLKNTIEELKDFTIQDLKALGYECVQTNKNSFFEPYDVQTLICVRKSEIDFHLMRYVDGDWMYKPGNSWILKYNGAPSADTDWHYEAAYPEENGEPYFIRCNEFPYTGDIYFIKYTNFHEYSTYTYYSNGEHQIICKYCETVLRKEPHIFKPYNEKAKQCKKCGFILYDSGFGQIIMKDEDKLI